MNPGQITVFVGDVTEYLADKARATDLQACHITRKNYKNLSPGVYYVSLGDLDSLAQLGETLKQADHIVYCPPQHWSDCVAGHSAMQTWTEDYCRIFSGDHEKIVDGISTLDFGLEQMLALADTRKTSSSQIWIAGCSISHGQGVDPDQRYGHILGGYINQPVSWLTMPGTSISWAADQILRSDIRSGDTVFWGLTNVARYTYWNDQEKKLRNWTPWNWDKEKKYLCSFVKENFLASDNVVYQSATAVKQVQNFCEKLDVDLVMATLLQGLEFLSKHIPGFVCITGTHGRNKHDKFLDLGTDGSHPGPRSHQYFADAMFSKLNQLKKLRRS